MSSPLKPWESLESPPASTLSVLNQGGLETRYLTQQTESTGNFSYLPKTSMLPSSFSQPFINSGNNYPQPFLPNRPIFNDPPGTQIEQSIRSAIERVLSVIKVVGNLAYMLDSTIYAAWSSIMAVLAIGENFKNFRDGHLRVWWNYIKSLLKWILHILYISKKQRVTANDAKEPGLNSTVWTALRLAIPACLAVAALSLLSGLPKSKTPIYCQALYNFSIDNPACVALENGDDLIMLDSSETLREWTLVRNLRTNEEGYAPTSFFVVKNLSHQ